MEINEQPLVSIIVITYNSSKFVLETLESAKAQTYQNIELIVSDDASTDNTVEICREWIDKNKERFVRTELITVEKNTGIPANCNRGLYAAKGEWLKFIAGDDILMENCIEDFLIYINNKSYSSFVSCAIIPFNENTTFLPTMAPAYIGEASAKKQFKILLKRGNHFNGASYFIRKNILINLGGFDENFKLLEDYPLLIKFTFNHNKIDTLNKPLVKYRLHNNNVSLTGKVGESYSQYRRSVLIPLCIRKRCYLTAWYYYIATKKYNPFIKRFLFILSPISVISKIYKLFGKNYFYRQIFIKG